MLPEHFRNSGVRRGGQKQHVLSLMSLIHQRRIHCVCLSIMTPIRGEFLSKVLGEAVTSPSAKAASRDIGWKDNKEIKVRLCGESLLADRITDFSVSSQLEVIGEKIRTMSSNSFNLSSVAASMRLLCSLADVFF